MEPKFIADDVAVGAQVCADDIAALKGQGFRSVICNRPDGESVDQPSFDEIAAAAKASGMEARHVPVQPGMMTQADVEIFSAAMAELPRPVLAYCRSGARSSGLWTHHLATGGETRT
jgi:sulfide:quinone oxidoreductase